MAALQDEQKSEAARAAVAEVCDGMAVGLGSGSTASFAIRHLADRIASEGLRIKGIPTSSASAALSRQLGIPLSSFEDIQRLDVTIDGADEFDPSLRLIKGGGGALLQEKIVATHSNRVLIVCDESKQVGRLGAFPLPVEVVRFGWENVFRELQHLGGAPERRGGSEAPFITDEGHYILDCHFGVILRPEELARTLDATVGVVEHGLFVGIATEILVATSTGVGRITRPTI